MNESRRPSPSLVAGFAAIALCAAGTAHAAPFTIGNVVVYRVGDGVAPLANTGAAVFLDEFTPAGTLVQSIPLPTSVSGPNRRLVASGTATSEGLLAQSADRNCLVLTGYDSAIPAAASLAGTASATVNRVIGVVGASGVVDTTTALTDAADGNNPRSAASTDCTALWITGGAGGIRSTTLGATTSTQLSTTVANLRQANVFDGQLYTSTSSGGAVRVGTVGTGTPTAAGQTITNLPGFPVAGSPYAYLFVDLDAGVAGVDTLYVAEDTASAGQIQKWSLVGGNWTATGTVAAAGVRGLTGFASGGTVQLFATTGAGAAAGGGSLYAFTDPTGYNGTASGTASVIASAAANTAFRGVALTPGTVPVELIGFEIR